MFAVCRDIPTAARNRIGLAVDWDPSCLEIVTKSGDGLQELVSDSGGIEPITASALIQNLYCLLVGGKGFVFI